MKHHPGSGRLRVIPRDWEAVHRPVAEGSMTATAAIREPGGTPGGWDAEAEQVTEVPHDPYFTGPCRVQALATQAGRTVVVEDPETTAGYLVTISADAAPLEGHLVTVTGSGDPLLDNRVLQIRQVVRGALRFERDLFCTFAD